MPDADDERHESPATWENVVVGKAKEFVGHLVGNQELADAGEDQADVAHEVRDEYDRDENDAEHHDR
jgi:uncharacterized protein YjbJ (UPF0337 family)